MLNIQYKPVINYMSGRAGFRPEAFVIHIAEGWLQGGYSWFNNPSSQVSSHFMIGKDGTIWQFVKLEDTAWHAGWVSNPNWGLLKPGVNPNLYTIGIEHEGFTGQPWTDAMYNATAELIGQISRDWGIPLDREHVIGHYQINSSSRANCPGSGVNLDNLVNLALNFYEDPIMIQQLKEKIASLEANIVSLNKTILESKNTIQTLSTQKQDLGQKIQTLEKQNTNLQQIVQQLSAESVKIKNRNIVLANEVKKLQTSEMKLTNKIIALEKRIKELGGKFI